LRSKQCIKLVELPRRPRDRGALFLLAEYMPYPNDNRQDYPARSKQIAAAAEVPLLDAHCACA